MPCLSASPDRGRTWHSYPAGIASRKPLGECQYSCGFHLALERTAKCCRDRDLRADTGVACGFGDLEPGPDAFIDTAALIPLAERFTGGDRHANLYATRRARTIETLPIQYQADVTRTRHGCERREHAFGVRHLWHAFGIDEARDFDTAQSRALQAAHEFYLCRRRQNL